MHICKISPNPRTPRENYCHISVTCKCTVETEMHVSNTFKNKLTTILMKNFSKSLDKYFAQFANVSGSSEGSGESAHCAGLTELSSFVNFG